MKKRQPYNKRDALPVNKVVAQYLAGDSLAKVAHTHGTSAGTVRRLLEQQGVPRRPAHEVFTKVPRKGIRGLAQSLPAEQIISKYRKGASLDDLAKEYKVSMGTIRRVMQAQGEERRSSAPEAGTSRAISPETGAEILRRYKQGLSLRAVANQFGISKDTVRRALAWQGFTRPDLPMEEIAKRRAAEEPARQLADEYGVSTSTINRRLRNMQ